ncbi:MAG: endo-1,4-beta-xylanase [Fimbriimonas sp.]|nr:endo-1,4-beta-xylanase [Fimbriimonas sp.]
MIFPLIALLTFSGIGQNGLVPVSLIQNGLFEDRTTTGWVSNATSLEVFAANEPSFKHELRATFEGKPGGNPWDTTLSSPSTTDLVKGRAVKIHAWLRSKTSSKIALIYEQSTQPYTKIVTKEIALTSDWTEYEAEGTATKTYAPGEAHLTIYLGYGTGSVDLANVRVETMGIPEPTTQTDLIGSHPLAVGEVPKWAPTGFSGFKAVNANQPSFVTATQATYPDVADSNPWDVSIHIPTVAAVRQGHTVYLRAWMRSPTSSKVSLIFERAAPPNNKCINTVFNLTPEWKEYRTAGICDGNYGVGEATVTIFLGYGGGTVEFGDLRAEDLRTTPIGSLPVTISYYGRPNSDAWRAPALARIEKYRKGDLTVRVEDSAGKPLNGATVKIDQVQQEFRFGTAAPAHFIVDKSSDGNHFRADLERFFNTVTFENDLKWHQVAPEDYTEVDAAFKWLAARGFQVRGHNLVWGSYQYMPPGIKEMSDQLALDTVRSRVQDMVARFKGRLYLWDVVNEAISEHQLWDRLGWDKFAQVYRWAREADPKVTLCYNDFDWTEEEETGSKHRLAAIKLVKSMLAQGVPIDAIGLQSHDGVPLTPITRVIEITKEIAKLGKPLEVTEYDLGVLDDRFNGEYLRDFLTAMYSVPQVQAFIMWGYWEGAHWRAAQGGAMVRKDWSLRPAALIWEDLVRRQWWTKLALPTSAAGTVHARAFCGTVRVAVTLEGKTVSKTVTVSRERPAVLTLRL